MKTSEIRILLQKYYEGSTSSFEEADLEKYFLNERVDAEFEADKLHFEALSSMRNEDIPVPEDLESSVLAALKKVQGSQRGGTKRIVYLTVSLAAALLLMVSTYIFVSRNDQSSLVSDPKIAYAESREALELVSKYFNDGTSRLSGLSKINQAIEPLSKLNSLDKAAKSLSEFGRSNH